VFLALNSSAVSSRH